MNYFARCSLKKPFPLKNRLSKAGVKADQETDQDQENELDIDIKKFR